MQAFTTNRDHNEINQKCAPINAFVEPERRINRIATIQVMVVCPLWTPLSSSFVIVGLLMLTQNDKGTSGENRGMDDPGYRQGHVVDRNGATR